MIICISISAFFVILKIINSLNLTYYYALDLQTINIIIFSQEIDALILMITLVLTSLIFVSHALISKSKLSFHYSKRLIAISCLIVTSTILLLIESNSLATWIWNFFDFSIPFANLEYWRFALIDLQLFNLFYFFLPWLFIVFLFSWIWLPLSKIVLKKITGEKQIVQSSALSNSEPKKIGNKLLSLKLFLIVFLAGLVAIYPLGGLSSSILVGTDAPYYYNWINQLHQYGPLTAFQMDRPFSNLLLYFAQIFTNISTEDIVRFAPFFCSASLSLAVFWFVKNGTQDRQLALISALFTIFSFQTSVSLYVYSLSNWMALILMFSILGILLLEDQRHFKIKTIIFTSLGLVTLLIHPYTWEVLILILATYAFFLLLKEKSKEKKRIQQISIFILVNLVFFALYSLLPFGQEIGNSGAVFLNHVTLNLNNLFNIENGLENMVKVWVGGLYANPLLIVLAIIGSFALTAFTKRFGQLMFFWIAIPSLALLFFAPDSFLYYRIVYLLPIQIFAAAGLSFSLSKLEKIKGNNPEKTMNLLKILIITLVILILLNYSLRVSDVVPLHVLNG